MWIFGYGSLLWKTGFPYEEKVVGYIKGCQRRFYQHSTDHRGIPSRPGRVVTLIPSHDPEERVYGIAYKIPSESAEEILERLDYREKGGYERRILPFHAKDEPGRQFDILIYVGTAENRQFAGEADCEAIARQVVDSVGPSGTNVEYVLRLAALMRQIAPGVADGHLFDVEAAVLKVLEETGRAADLPRMPADA